MRTVRLAVLHHVVWPLLVLFLGCGANEAESQGAAGASATGGAGAVGGNGSSLGGSGAGGSAAGAGATAGAGGGAGMTGGGAGTAGGASGQCADIYLTPPKLYLGWTEWITASEGLMRLVAGTAEGGIVRMFDASGGVVAKLDLGSQAGFGSMCAWRGLNALCFGGGATSNDAVLVDFSMLGQIPTTQPLPPLIPDDAILVAVHWDGEAYAVHIRSDTKASGGLELIRLNEAGSVILPRTLVGTKANGTGSTSGTKVLTDATSGRSYAVDGTTSDVTVASGHERDGTPLWPHGTQFKQSVHSSENPGLGTYPEGVLFVAPNAGDAKNLFPKPNLFRLRASGTLDVVGTVPLNDGWTASEGVNWIAVHATDADNGWFVLTAEPTTKLPADAIQAQFVIVDFVNGVMQKPRVLMDAPKWSPSERPLRLDYPVALEIDGRRWVGVQDNTVAGKSAVRLLRVDDPSCTYPRIAP